MANLCYLLIRFQIRTRNCCGILDRNTAGRPWQEAYTKNHLAVFTTFIISPDLLRTGQCGDRIPVEAKTSATVQAGPGAHSALNTTGNGSLSRGIAPTSSVEVKEETRAAIS